jgi:hypothetical protein
MSNHLLREGKARQRRIWWAVMPLVMQVQVRIWSWWYRRRASRQARLLARMRVLQRP